MSEAYGAFAYAYDKALGERYFESVRGLLDDTAERVPQLIPGARHRSHLDVACGSGLALAHMRASGWKSVGLDLSVPMLRVARRREPGVPLVAGDFRALPFDGRFSFVTCLYDSLNHLLEVDELAAAFTSIRSVMAKGALFFFDMNEPGIYPVIWGLKEPFVSEGKTWELEVATRWRRREKLGVAEISGWASIDGERIEIREQLRQRAYSEKEINGALKAASFSILDVMDFDPFEETGRVVKLVYVCEAC